MEQEILHTFQSGIKIEEIFNKYSLNNILSINNKSFMIQAYLFLRRAYYNFDKSQQSIESLDDVGYICNDTLIYNGNNYRRAKGIEYMTTGKYLVELEKGKIINIRDKNLNIVQTINIDWENSDFDEDDIIFPLIYCFGAIFIFDTYSYNIKIYQFKDNLNKYELTNSLSCDNYINFMKIGDSIIYGSRGEILIYWNEGLNCITYDDTNSVSFSVNLKTIRKYENKLSDVLSSDKEFLNTMEIKLLKY